MRWGETRLGESGRDLRASPASELDSWNRSTIVLIYRAAGIKTCETIKIMKVLKVILLTLTATSLIGLSNCQSTGGDPVLEADGRESSFDKETDYEHAVGDELDDMRGNALNDESTLVPLR